MAMQHTLRALADPIRREILNLLKKGRLSAGEITDCFPVTGASISRHLSVLKDADLIRDTREGKFIFYELNTSVLEDVMLWTSDLKGDNQNVEKEQSRFEKNSADTMIQNEQSKNYQMESVINEEVKDDDISFVKIFLCFSH